LPEGALFWQGNVLPLIEKKVRVLFFAPNLELTTEPWRLGDFVEQHWWFSPVLLVLDVFETTILTIRNICALSFFVTLNKRNLEVLCCVEENIFSFIRARAHTQTT
jgi:hypothetical protein